MTADTGARTKSLRWKKFEEAVGVAVGIAVPDGFPLSHSHEIFLSAIQITVIFTQLSHQRVVSTQFD
jgi:hypothetical protein